MQYIRKPLFILAVASALMAVLGSLMGWFTIGNELVKSIADTELGKKEMLSLLLSILCLSAVIIGAAIHKHRLAFIALPVSLYGLVLIINQKPEAAIVEQIALTVNIGYWMSILGTLGIILTSAIIGIKGFTLITEKE